MARASIFVRPLPRSSTSARSAPSSVIPSGLPRPYSSPLAIDCITSTASAIFTDLSQFASPQSLFAAEAEVVAEVEEVDCFEVVVAAVVVVVLVVVEVEEVPLPFIG